ncbi:MAG: Tat pathway signal protein [Rhizobiaceae bacterium]
MILGTGVLALAGGATYLATQGPSYEESVDAIWKTRAANGSDDLDYLVHYARLAANSHNTQPWMFRKTADGVLISPDMSRATPVVDPDSHHLFASLGCAAENLALAASAQNRSAAVDFIDQSDGGVQVSLGKGPAGKDALFDAIIQRQCTRNEYDGRIVASHDLKSLEVAAQIDGSQVILITARPSMDQILELILAGNTTQIENPAFAEELKSWLRFNSSSAVSKADGLYAACSGNPTMPSWLGNLMFGFVFTATGENEKCVKQIKSSAGLAIFVADKDDKEHWIKAGRSYQRFALQATSLGLKHAFLNQAVEVPEQRAKLAALLGIGNKRPNLLVRFGYGPSMPRSMRRPIAEVISSA